MVLVLSQEIRSNSSKPMKAAKLLAYSFFIVIDPSHALLFESFSPSSMTLGTEVIKS